MVFLSTHYLAIALIKFKKEVFNENFATMAEINQFHHYMQQEFNNRNLKISIVPEEFDRDDFLIMGDIIMMPVTCYDDLDEAHIDLYNILTDAKLIGEFFKKLENEKLKRLENVETIKPKIHKIKKG